jgi:putative ABC transport system ATP-binding protein
MTLAPVAPAARTGVDTIGSPPILAAEGLRMRFGQTEALRGIDFELARGEIVAVMGPSGSGKSTLLHCLAGILAPDEGSVTFDGRRVDRLGDGERSRLRRTSFGFVFQFGQLVPELTSVENVALPLLLNGESRSAALERAAAWFPRLGLDGLAGRRPGEMSGGQAQRVAVARAMVIEPSIVFADEPTGSLDSLAGEQVMELLTGSAREQGTSVVLVTHEPRVAAYARREIVVRDGRVSGPGR